MRCTYVRKGEMVMWNLIATSTQIPPTTQGTDDAMGALEAFFNSTVLTWVTWGITILFVILVIMAGVSFAMAKSPEEKQAAKSRFISLGIGLLIVFSATIIVNVAKELISGIWG